MDLLPVGNTVDGRSPAAAEQLRAERYPIRGFIRNIKSMFTHVPIKTMQICLAMIRSNGEFSPF